MKVIIASTNQHLRLDSVENQDNWFVERNARQKSSSRASNPLENDKRIVNPDEIYVHFEKCRQSLTDKSSLYSISNLNESGFRVSPSGRPTSKRLTRL
jgi:hypothetical protein